MKTQLGQIWKINKHGVAYRHGIDTDLGMQSLEFASSKVDSTLCKLFCDK